jgi:hypothetical protein
VIRRGDYFELCTAWHRAQAVRVDCEAWFQNYTAQSIAAELKANGFSIEYLGGNLRGGALTDSSEWIGIVATKVE